jgi:tRNA G37 N-methylase TrmD
VDERIRTQLATDEISIGDYVLTGGELPALIVLDAVARLLPGVLGDPEGAADDSHATGLLEYAHYTRPPEFRGWGVPEVLLSGDHAKIETWRRQQSLLRTARRRPDLLAKAELDEQDRKFLEAGLTTETTEITEKRKKKRGEKAETEDQKSPGRGLTTENTESTEKRKKKDGEKAETE